jgi:sigma-B regulation protein RsbU (phosphoserine phosphatase)
VALMDDGVWKAGAASLAAGDLLALYTDGIPEAWNADDEDYGDERLRALLASLHGRPTAEVRDAVLADVKAFVGEAPTSDDVTLVLLRRLS